MGHLEALKVTFPPLASVRPLGDGIITESDGPWPENQQNAVDSPSVCAVRDSVSVFYISYTIHLDHTTSVGIGFSMFHCPSSLS